jgi:hypothetical protein
MHRNLPGQGERAAGDRHSPTIYYFGQATPELQPTLRATAAPTLARLGPPANKTHRALDNDNNKEDSIWRVAAGGGRAVRPHANR